MLLRNLDLPRGVIIVSGGIDSTVLLHALADRGLVAHAVMFDYGQASADTQDEYLRFHTEECSVDYSRERVTWPEYGRGKGYIFGENLAPEHPKDPYAPLTMTEEEYDGYLENTWDFIQGRNMVFLTLACSRAASLGLDTVYTGFQFDKPEWESIGAAGLSGTDTGPAFCAAFNEVLACGGFSKPMQVLSPLLDLKADKFTIAAEGRRLGVDLNRTHSCEFFPPCGVCHQCIIRARVLKKRRYF